MSDTLEKQVGGNHYRGMVIQPIEFCHRNKIPAIEASVIRYVCRHRNKGGREDIEKAIHLLEMLLEFDYSQSPPPPPPLIIESKCPKCDNFAAVMPSGLCEICDAGEVLRCNR